jgi:tetratricopeptide (TPR) repeat protein
VKPRPKIRQRSRLPRVVALVALVIIAGGFAVRAVVESRSRPARVRRLEAEARINLAHGRPDEAEHALADAVALLPPRPETVIALASVRRSLGRADEAERDLVAALARAPGERELTVALADLDVSRGKAAEAAKLVAPFIVRFKALADPLDRSRSLLVAGRAAAGVGAFADAEALLRDAARAPAHAPATPELALARAEALLALGELLVAGRRFADAESALAEAEALVPTDARIKTARALALEKAGQRDEAITHLEESAARPGALALEPASALGDMLVRAGRIEEARKLAERLAQEPDGKPLASSIRGGVALAMGDFPAAEAELGQVARAFPRSARVQTLRAEAALGASAFDRAREAFEAASAAEPGSPEAELGLLHLDERAGEATLTRKRARRLLGYPATRMAAMSALLALGGDGETLASDRAALEALLERAPRDPGLRFLTAVLAVLAGDATAGARELEPLAARGPDVAVALGLKGKDPGDGCGALETVERVAELGAKDARFAGARVALALVLERIGRPDLALPVIEAALVEAPSLVSARVARVRLARGDPAGAIAELEELRRDHPDEPLVLEALADRRLNAAEYEKAVELLAAARKLAPGSAVAVARLALGQALAKDRAGALASFEAARALDASCVAAQQDGPYLLSLGEIAAARAALARALDATGDPRFAGALAVASALARDPAAALESWKTWESRSPPAVEGAVAKAMLLVLGGVVSGARETLEAAPVSAELRASVLAIPATTDAQAPLAPDVQLELEIFAFSILGWSHEVRSRVERVASGSDDAPRLVWWATRGDGWGMSPEARLGLARRRAVLEPSSLGAAFDLAAAQRAAGDGRGELATFRALEPRVSARGPDGGAFGAREQGAFALRLGMALDRAGDAPSAIDRYERAAQLAGNDSERAVALNNVAWLRSLGNLDEGIARAREAVRLDPELGEAQDTLGSLLCRSGKLAEAIPHLERAVALRPGSPSARYHLATALDGHGEKGRAAHHLDVAFGLRAAFPEEAEARTLSRTLAAPR